MSVQKLLKSELKRRQKLGAYTQKQFAEDLGISPSFLLRVLNEDRHLSQEKALQIAKRLSNDKNFIKNFVAAALLPDNFIAPLKLKLKNQLPSLPSGVSKEIEQERFKFISEWQHMAVITLFKFSNFRYNSRWIAKKLGIDYIKVEVILERFKLLGILDSKSKEISQQKINIIVKDAPSDAILKYHRGWMKLAFDSLSNQNHNQRFVGGMTMAVDREYIQEANRRITEFSQELAEFLETSGSPDTLYHFNINLFQVDQQ